MRLIDADTLKLTFRIGKINDESEIRTVILKAIVEAIKEVPTVDAVPVRHGKWKVTPVYIKCSECGESFMLIPQNYCPNCGARMDK